MRARHTAFFTNRIGDFLFDTLSEEMKALFERGEVERSARDVQALGLEIRSTTDGGPEDETGTVEYVARYRVRGQVQAHHELATFRRENGRWLYANGEVNPKQAPRQVEKIGRNDPCVCGSGKKYKKCCGA